MKCMIQNVPSTSGRGREDKRTNNRTMFPSLKNNATTRYQGPVKLELLKGAGLLSSSVLMIVSLNLFFASVAHDQGQ